MRIVLCAAVLAALALVLPSAGQAGSICSQCPLVVLGALDLGSPGPTVGPEIAPEPLSRYEEGAFRRAILVLQATDPSFSPPTTGGSQPGGGSSGGSTDRFVPAVAPEVVPEPATGLLAAMGIVALAVRRRLRA